MEMTRTYFAPGRVNLIGEHLDYNGGHVMPCCIDLGITAQVKNHAFNKLKLTSTSHNSFFEFDLDTLPNYAITNDWANYPLGVVHFLKQKGIEIPALEINFESNLPQGSGLSSSAAIEVLMAYILLTETNQSIDRKTIALWCQQVENEFIGVKCGIMDQFIIANGTKDNVLFLNCNTLDFETVPFELDDYRLMVMNTNKPRSLIKSAYNERKASCDESLAIIQSKRNITFLAEADMTDLDLLKDPILKKRTRHVISEELRVLQAKHYLEMGDLMTVGRLMTASHVSLQYDYEVSGVELDTLVESALEQKGCIGARMTGAGFGGCAIALVHQDETTNFTVSIEGIYKTKLDLDCTIYITQTKAGVHQISSELSVLK
jgi:galactokinase